jgi:hypothetical protein
LPIDIFRQVHPAWLAFIRNARSNINAIAKDVVAVDDDIANGYSHPKLDARRGPLGRSFRHFLLNRNSATHGIHGTRELDQQAVAGGLDNAATVRRNSGVDDFTPMRFQCL